MTVWFTSDTHISHANVIKYSKRPFKNVTEMNGEIMNRWNEVVRPGDTVYHLGDVASEKDEDYLYNYICRLNGQKHLILGNHDRGILKTNVKSLFASISTLKDIKVDDQHIVLCHYAMRVWNKSHYGAWQLFGHSHGSLPDDPNLLSCDVGVDCWNYTPVSFEQLKHVMSKKTFKPIDHHGRNRND